MNKYIVLTLIVSLLITTSSCIKEKTTLQEAYINNNTNHSIKVLPYELGYVSAEDTLRLNPNGRLRIDNGGSQKGTPGPGFDAVYGHTDSVHVLFDNSYQITHYVNLPNQLNPKYYDFNNPRNILNPNNYNFEQEKIKKHSYRNIHDFTFIEQDYIDAQ